MNALKLTIDLNEPLLMTGVANGEENSSATLDYIPGSALRGMCAAAYLRAYPQTEGDLAAHELARALFFSLRVRFLNGYPAHPNDPTRRALPCPLSWVTEKDQFYLPNHSTWDLAVEPDVTETDPAGEPNKLKSVRRPFFWQEDRADDDPLALFSPPRRVTVHNASDDPRVKGPAMSTVFRYEALAARQHFIAYIISEEAALLNELRHDLSNGPIFLGGSQTAGYGRATLTVAPKDETWTWEQGEAQVEEVDDFTIVTLLSDAILRTPDGQPSTDLPAALRSALKRAELPNPECIFSQTQVVGGFNRKWGLPLPQQWAVARGSTLVYRAADLPTADLESILLIGIGERRNEGFGRIGVNLNPREVFSTQEPSPVSASAGALSDGSKDLARQMARRRLWAAVQAAIPEYLGKVHFFANRPRNTQLSRVRQVVREGQQQGNLQLVTEHLDRLRKTARDQFTNNRLDVPGGHRTWEQWLRDRAAQHDALDLLKLDPAERRFQIANEDATADAGKFQKLKVEVTALLVDAVLRKAIKTGE
ncbi:MAG: RAMP superfamily CRISPR-associated protein [Ardenticatenaceae bacterium]